MDRDGEPILVEKGREARAVLIPLKLFQERFVDKAVHAERLLIQEAILERQKRKPRSGPRSDVLLRALRGPLP